MTLYKLNIGNIVDPEVLREINNENDEGTSKVKVLIYIGAAIAVLVVAFLIYKSQKKK